MRHFAPAAAAFVAALLVIPFTASASGRFPTASPDASRYAGLLFVADGIAQSVYVCPTGNLRVGVQPATEQLQGVTTPTQLAIDASGTVYVANGQIDANGDGAIGVYPRGQLTPSRTLSTGLNTVTGVAVDSSGNVYASNKYLATVSVFASGGSQP